MQSAALYRTFRHGAAAHLHFIRASAAQPNVSRSNQLPARSNQFQRLVAEIHSGFGAGWTVTESLSLEDSVTKSPREVDVVASSVVAGYSLLVGIEVRDKGRPADVTWVESLAKKHEHLPTNKLVLWSSTGFSENALLKAKALNIEAITPQSGTASAWAQIARDLVGASVKYVRPRFAPGVEVTLADGSIATWPTVDAMILSEVGGTREAQVGVILEQIAQNPKVRTVLLDHAPEGSGSFHATYELPFPCVVTGPGAVIARVNRLVIGIQTISEIAPVVAKSALHNGTVTTLAEAQVSDGTLQVVVNESEGKAPAVKTTLRK